MPARVSSERRAHLSSQKTVHCGIETPDAITWTGWHPGGEYTQHVTLKNICFGPQKIRYKVPVNRVFYTQFPQPVTLNAGTSFTLPITFKPLEKNIYVDKIEFNSSMGDFEIPVQALLPKHDITVPDHLNFGFCAVQDCIKISFDITNIGDLTTSYEWQVLEPFEIDPSEGTLPPKTSATIKVKFRPMAAQVYEVKAVCKYGDDEGSSKELKLEGIGKYPHLVLTDGFALEWNYVIHDSSQNMSAFDFKNAIVGSPSTRMLTILNKSPVNANFTVEHTTSKQRFDNVFTCKQMKGVVPPNGDIAIPFEFKPQINNMRCVDYFTITAGGNTSTNLIKCMGYSAAVCLRMSTDVINYNCVNLGDKISRTFTISSRYSTVFQFQIDSDESVFKFSQTCGMIRCKDRPTAISVEFNPRYPMVYYRRVACLIPNEEPMYLDLIGTCHTSDMNPPVAKKHHIDRYYTHVYRGLSTFPPEQLGQMLTDSKLQLDGTGNIMLPEAEVLEDFITPPVNISSSCEYFNDGHYGPSHLPVHVSVDLCDVDFQTVRNYSKTYQKTVNVINHTKGKMTVVWTGDTDRVFSMSPQSIDIPPLKTYSFRVTFKPDGPNRFYGNELEGYAFYKSMRDFTLIQDATFSPPWCLTVNATGSTFEPGHETFVPRLSVNTNRLIFPAVLPNQSTYSTLLLGNHGPTPMLFEFEDDNTGIFTVKPRRGVLKDKYKVITIKAVPQGEKIIKHRLKCRLNNAEKYTKQLVLLASGEGATVHLDNQACIYFKPTCIGTVSRRIYKVKNTNRLPLKFEWKINHTDCKYLSVSPTHGTILPNESQAHKWSFSPSSDKKYTMKPYLLVTPVPRKIQSSSDETPSSIPYLVRVIGEGSKGRIVAESSLIDYEDVIVGCQSKRDIVLYNNNECNLHYKLYIEQTIEGPYSMDEMSHDPPVIDLAISQGVLPARGKQSISAYVKPIRRVDYSFAIYYTLVRPHHLAGDNDDSTVKQSSNKKHHLCDLRLHAVFPSLQVTDARCYNGAAAISKAILWNMLELDQFNIALESDPTTDELVYTSITRFSTSASMPARTRSIITFNFGAGPISSPSSDIKILLNNPGTVPCKWALLYPTDIQLELDYWSETGYFQRDELHEMKIMDNKLFTISPTNGCLEPGQSQDVTLTYSHVFAETHQLPVMFKIMDGREILVNFLGVTVPREQKYIHFSSNKHQFTPVAIGSSNNPKQVQELYNAGAVPVEYIIDLRPLTELHRVNYNSEILECLTPTGVIETGQTAVVEWMFSPLQAKPYSVDIPIKIVDGDTAIITYEGIGYDSRDMGDTMPLKVEPDSGVTAVQKVIVPGQLAYLSEERFSFGNLPLFSKARHVIHINNISQTHSVTFRWFVTSESARKVIEIHPLTDRLEPGGDAVVRFTIISTSPPSFYDIDVICEVTDEHDMAEYEKVRTEWDNERIRQQYEFTITEENVDDDTIGCEKPLSEPRMMSDVNRPTSAESFNKYTTLPPIKKMFNEVDRSRKNRVMSRRQTDTGTPVWDRPNPPEPFTLHLGITARTHSLQEFNTYFSHHSSKHFIDRTLCNAPLTSEHTARPESRGPVLPVECDKAELCLVSDCMANIIRNLLDDTVFQRDLALLDDEPIPYFVQYKDRHPRPLTTGGLVDLGTVDIQINADSIQQQSDESLNLKTSAQSINSKPSTGKALSQKSTTPSRAEQQVDPVLLDTTPSLSASLDDLPVHSVESIKTPESPEPVPDDAFSLPLTRGSTQLMREMVESYDELEEIRMMPEFGIVLENILENSIFNIVNEAAHGRLPLTSLPRRIVQTPVPPNE